MLHFFRTHQRYLFIVFTVIIILSFSFFGTYQTIETSPPPDRVAFTAVDGQPVHMSEVEAMALFLATDTLSRGQGIWSTNFLNDGVLSRDFFQTGLAQRLAVAYADELQTELEPKLRREQKAKFYTHPNARFISAEGVWNYFSPNLVGSLRHLRQADMAVSPDGFQARVDLFLAEQQFPAAMLMQMLRYQEQQYPWITPDPNLPRQDLALFGYHSFEEWFGSRFMRLVCQFIINSAKIAEQKGYEVTLSEALASLMSQAELSYKQLVSQYDLGLSGPQQFLNEQLRRTGLDEVGAAKVWRQVLLFRRLFEGVGNAVFVDPLLMDQYTGWALQGVQGNLFSLPDSLHLADFRALQQFETYLAAVTDKENNKQPLELPTRSKTVAEVQKNHPDLVQKRYLVELADVSKRSLQARVVVKQMWDWEVDGAHWETLKKEFPELALRPGSTSEERFAALESLDPTTRARVDEFARAEIVDAHPEWLTQALEKAQPQTVTLGLRWDGGNLPIQGVTDRKALAALLDAAPLGEQEPSSPQARDAQKALQTFSGDGRNYYRVRVVERQGDWEILTYGEAASDDTLNKKLLATLEPFYVKLRTADPAKYRKSDQSWKPLAEVQDLVAAEYFRDLVNAIESEYRAFSGVPATDTKALGANGAAPYRFLWNMKQARSQLEKDPSFADTLVSKQVQEESNPESLSQAAPLADQWKLVRKELTVRRSEDTAAGRESVFQLKPGDWSQVQVKGPGDLWFFEVTGTGESKNSVIAAEELQRARETLGDDAQRQLMTQLLLTMQEKHAISLAYMGRREPSSTGGDTHDATQGRP